ncbi:DUF1574 domain-containing protein [Phormidium sp. LEGE 05292]|uniref:DUF1574 domain-containing protein n=1 Tax=[Phormidium] sp. LEGE 05292 TaxID=767427 RepID=UPI00187E998C|nr:DUF1574 domain-containing protein [Phormidium sp. LEGE 05292]MBE9225273.1 DUF1574 domain-containing protein [Phormidium sp. LEGE 05292]
MLNIEQRQITSDPINLTQWVERELVLAGMQVRARVRENTLHILWEGRDCPNRQKAIERVTQALQAIGRENLLSGEQLPINRVFLYGRVLGEKKPNWTEQLDIQQLVPSRTTHSGKAPQVKNSQELAMKSVSEGTASEEIVSSQVVEVGDDEYWESQARQGNADAIAHYLSKHLSHLGVTVKVITKILPVKTKSKHRENPFKSKDLGTPKQRLWVFCESGYSPDPSLLAAPVAQQLRELNLAGFQDAVILSQVTGEESPDWMLRVDLTPPEEMLREWAQWGDEVAIERLLNRPQEHGMEISAVIKESTLHLSCTTPNWERIKQFHRGNYNVRPDIVPDKHRAIAILTPIIRTLAPQGLKAGIIYGHEHLDETPVWVEWLDLPGNNHPQLGQSTRSLAANGDEEALEFLLGQLLNTDIDWRLATGGIRIQVRRREDLLYVMTDALICPLQQQVGSPVVQFISELQIPGIAGVRVYGRRAGEKQPSWSYGRDFTARGVVVPESTPEFATSEHYVTEKIDSDSEEIVFTSEIPDTEDLPPGWLETQFEKLQERVGKFGQSCYATLTRSQICTPSETTQNFLALPGNANYSGAKVALVWGALGIMLALSTDLIVGSVLKMADSPQQNSPVLNDAAFREKYENENLTPEKPAAANTELVQENTTKKRRSRQRKRRQPENIFDTTGFTKPGDTEVKVDPTGENATLNVKHSDLPSFDNTQFDEKLAIYKKQIEKQGPPDVLIVGSSRAMRGIDPAILQKALAEQGYGKVQIFNFGINGGTAQIADLLIRRVLTPEEMPKLIIWADGARAMNSGRFDLTYSKLTTSPGYKGVEAGTFHKLEQPEDLANQTPKNQEAPTIVAELSENMGEIKAQDVDNLLNQKLGEISASYEERDRLNTKLRDWFANSFGEPEKPGQVRLSNEEIEERPFNWDGFLPISLRFNPDTYYENHAKVKGDYDTDYKDFYLGGPQNAALESLVQYTQSLQIPLVFINLPLTKEYLDSHRRQYEKEFEIYMLRLSLRKGFVFRNWNQLWPNKNEYFSDPSHLNRYGAAAVAQRLALDPLIPWPKEQGSKGAEAQGSRGEK